VVKAVDHSDRKKALKQGSHRCPVAFCVLRSTHHLYANSLIAIDFLWQSQVERALLKHGFTFNVEAP
jgi:hypothetical protein